MVKIVLDINKLQEQLTIGTQHLSQHVVAVAQTAATSIVAGLKTCDERSAGNLTQFEVRVNPDATSAPYSDQNKNSNPMIKNYENLIQSLSIPAIGISVDGTKANPHVADTWGSFSFNFKFILETTGKHAGFLVASACNADGSSVRLICRWKRKIANIFIDIHGANETEYPISADDIGSKIIVEARAIDSDHPHEIAYAELGPFELDAAMRRNLDNYLALGNATFRLLKKPTASEMDQEEFVCTISEHELKVVKQGLSNGSFTGKWSCKYGADFPWIRILNTDLCSFDLYLSRENKLSLSTLTRYQRDLLALTVRCFHGRQWLENSLLLNTISLNANKLSDVNSNAGLESTSQKKIAPPTDVDFFVILHRLMSELHRSLSVAEKSVKERDRAQIEKIALEKDIAATLQAYQKLLLTQANVSGNSVIKTNDQQTAQCITLDITERAAYVAELEVHLKNAEKQSKKYLTDLERLRKDFSDLKTKSSNNGNKASPVIDTKHEDVLFNGKTQHYTRTEKELLDIVQQKNDAEKEVERLRITLQGLQVLSESTQKLQISPSEKESLENKVTDLLSRNEQLLEEKKKLLKDNDALTSQSKLLAESFLYLKSKYDQETANIQASTDLTTTNNDMTTNNISDSLLMTTMHFFEDIEEKHFFGLIKAQSELDSVKSELEKVITERNRYQKQVQILSRDLEKAQNQLQTVMGFQKELNNNKISAEASLQDLHKRLSKQQGEVEDLKNLQFTVEQLKKELEEKVTNIEKLQKENELFRSRLRKMAAV